MTPTTRSMTKINRELNIIHNSNQEEIRNNGRVFYKLVLLNKPVNSYFTSICHKIPAIAWLYIPESVHTNQNRKLKKDGNADFAKYRAQKAYVIQLTTLAGNVLSKNQCGYSCLGIPFIKYIPGEWVIPTTYEFDIRLVLASGIHYFKTVEACIAFLANPEHLNYGRRHYYKPFLPDGTYNRYDNDGVMSSQKITYKAGIIVKIDYEKDDIPLWFYSDMNISNYYNQALENNRCDEVERTAFEKYLAETL